jgi:hypothetical protein
VTLTLYEKTDKDMVTLSIMTCSDAHAHYPYLSLPMGKNINNNSGLLLVKCYIGIIYALTDIIFILKEHLHLLVPAFLASC